MRQRLSFPALALWCVLTAAACGPVSLGNNGAADGGTADGGTSSTSTSGDKCTTDRWDEVTAGPFTCAKNEDCCVVYDACQARAQIVKADDFGAARTAWPDCGQPCALCDLDPVRVSCLNGTCVGETVSPPEDYPELMVDHCGVTHVDVGTPSIHPTFGCGG
jgi:hypothetical protein